MKIFIIAQIFASNNTLVGYRLIDVESKDGIRDTKLDVVAGVLNNPNTANLIKNAKFANGKILGTNGQLSRYAKITTGGALMGNSPLVIINKIDDVGYTVCDFKGMIQKMKVSDVVAYAKANGIANGKVVVQDNVEYISSIAEPYDQITVSPSKVGSAGRVKLNIHIDSDSKSIAKNTAADLDAELQYNDVFSAMNSTQRSVLKKYYTWYTVDVYKGLAKNTRLNLAPGKAEKLAQLRGIDKWQFAGVNDSFLEGNYKAKCELGHNLRYEYFAIPEELADGAHARVKDWRVRGYNGFRTTRGQQDDLRDRGAIVFGETCAGDFFNIAPEDMKKLVKTRKTMSDEIELMANIITNNETITYVKKCTFLYESLKALGSGENIIKVFGDKVGSTLVAFMQASLPFPKSLVILAGDEVRKDMFRFFSSVYSEYKDTIKRILVSNKGEPLHNIKDVFAYIANYSIEGDYQYNPLTDKESTRRDIGAYNKDTRAHRTYLIRKLFSTSALIRNNESPELFSNLGEYIKIVDRLLKLGEDALAFASNNTLLSERLKNKTAFNTNLERIACNRDKSDPVYIKDIATIISSLSLFGFSTTVKVNYHVAEYYSGIKRASYFKDFKDLKEYYTSEFNKDNNSIIENGLGNIVKTLEDEARIQKEREEELGKIVHKCKLYINQGSKTMYDLGNDVWMADITAKDIKSINNEEYQHETIDGYFDKEIRVSDIYLIETFNPNSMYSIKEFRSLERLCKDIINKQKEEAKLIEALKDKEIEAETKTEKIENNTKLSKMLELKELIQKLDPDKLEYGEKVCLNIIERGIEYDKLSSKQKWRIDETYNKLKGIENNDSSADVNIKSNLADNKEVAYKVDKILKINISNNVKAIQDMNSASRIAVNIARTVKTTGKFSDKQLKHIDKAYKAIEDVQI